MTLEIAGLEDLIEIGRGGFATVYRAYQPAFRRTVAVKVLNSTNLDELSQERFRRECQAMGLLSEHPSIVTVLDAGFLDSGQAYMVMPFMPAGSLADKVRAEGPMPWAEASRVAVKLAGALHAAHDAGVVHRDVKPANVLISEYGEPKLADFGIARVAGSAETQSGVVTASLAFAPPEVIEGKRPTVQSDIYSLGATIYDLVAGHAPFEVGDATSVAAILNRILNQEPPSLAARGVPEPFAEVIAQAMAKDPADRPESAAALGRAIRLVQDELGIKPTELTILKVEALDPAAQDAGPDQPTEPDPHRADPEPETVDVTASTAPAIGASTPGPAARDDGSTQAVPSSAAPPEPRSTESFDAADEPRRRLLVPVAVGLAVVVLVIVGIVIASGGSDEPTVAEPAGDEPAVDDAATDSSVPGDTEPNEAEAADDGATDTPPPDGEPMSNVSAGTGPTIPTFGEACPDGLDGSRVPTPGVDLQGERFEGLDWGGADLGGINFFGSTLYGVDLRGANLDGVNFDTAHLDTVLVEGATFSFTQFRGTRFSRVDLQDFDFGSSTVTEGLLLLHVEAREFDFTALGNGVDFLTIARSDISGANLSGLHVNEISHSIAVDATLDGIRPFEQATFLGPFSVYDGASMRDAQFVNADLVDTSFVDVDLTGATLDGAAIHRADMTGATVAEATADGTEWIDVTCPDGSTSSSNLGVCPIG